MDAVHARLARILVLLALAAAPASAEVVRVEVQSRAISPPARRSARPARTKRSPARSSSRVDPALRRQPHRRRHRQGAAQRRGQGRVLVRLLPDQAEGHRARQRRRALRSVEPRRQGDARFLQPRDRQRRPGTAPEIGDGFLMRQGFTLLWVGWQFDVPKRPGLVRVYPPIATDNGRPIRGLVRSDFVVTEREADHSLADRDHAGLRRRRSGVSRQRDDGARLGRRGRAASFRAASGAFDDPDRDARLHGGEIRAEQDLRGGLHG